MERIIKSQPISNVFDVVSKHPALILNDRPGTKDILDSLMKADPGSFAEMAVKLKSSGGENIMHFLAKENLIDGIINLISIIERKIDRITATELMFSRNLVGRNSPMMIMIQRIFMKNENLSNEEKEKITFIWNACVENPWVKVPSTKILCIKGPELVDDNVIEGDAFCPMSDTSLQEPILPQVKFVYSEKATNILRNIHLFFDW